MKPDRQRTQDNHRRLNMALNLPLLSSILLSEQSSSAERLSLGVSFPLKSSAAFAAASLLSLSGWEDCLSSVAMQPSSPVAKIRELAALKHV